MPRFTFREKRESGIPDTETYFDIPEEGNLPTITYKWDGTKYNVSGDEVYSQEKRVEITWCSETTESMNITWIKERQEWIAYKIIHKKDRTDAYGFYDEFYKFKGPWSLDYTHKKALLVAYDVLDKFDISEAHKIPPKKLLNK